MPVQDPSFSFHSMFPRRREEKPLLVWAQVSESRRAADPRPVTTHSPFAQPERSSCLFGCKCKLNEVRDLVQVLPYQPGKVSLLPEAGGTTFGNQEPLT